MNITITDNLGVVLNAEVEVITRKVVSMAIDDRVDAELAYVAMAVVSGVVEAESMIRRSPPPCDPRRGGSPPGQC